MNALIIIRGESFRTGESASRNIGSRESYDTQSEASKSHLRFLKNLKNKNVNLDLNIATYKTQFLDECISWYNEEFNIISTCIKDNSENTNQGSLIRDAMKPHFDDTANIPNLSSYDFIFFLRFDCYLKEKFIEIFDPHWNTIRFPFVMYWQSVNEKTHAVNHFHHEYQHKTNLSYFPVVSDIMWFVPNKYISNLFEGKHKRVHPWHDAWPSLITFNDLTFEDMDVMVNTMHRANSSIGSNPLYKISGRNEQCNGRRWIQTYFNKNEPPK